MSNLVFLLLFSSSIHVCTCTPWPPGRGISTGAKLRVRLSQAEEQPEQRHGEVQACLGNHITQSGWGLSEGYEIRLARQIGTRSSFLNTKLKRKPLRCTVMKRIHRAKVFIHPEVLSCQCAAACWRGMCFVKVDVGQEFDFWFQDKFLRKSEYRVCTTQLSFPWACFC